MKEIKTEIIINAAADNVWNTLTNFNTYSAWNPFIINIEGTLAQGGKLVNTMLVNGKKNVFKPIITKVEKGKSFEWLGSIPLGLFKGNHYFILESIDNNTTKLIHGERFTGLLSSLILRSIGEETKRGFIAMNEALKSRVES